MLSMDIIWEINLRFSNQFQLVILRFFEGTSFRIVDSPKVTALFQNKKKKMYLILTYLHNNIRVHLLIGPIIIRPLTLSVLYIFVHANIKIIKIQACSIHCELYDELWRVNVKKKTSKQSHLMFPLNCFDITTRSKIGAS